MQQIPYGEVEHDVNTFRGNDQTAQSLCVKNAPPGFAEFCRHEAKDVEIPLFGKNRNLTVEGQLAKDPAMFALMKVAQQVRETWAREDVAAAQAKRLAAANEPCRGKNLYHPHCYCASCE